MASEPGRLEIIDLQHLGKPDSIAVFTLGTKSGLLLVDPGPSSTLPRLFTELEARGHGAGDVTALLLTHIHLDHSGAAGTLTRKNPKLRVYVHARGSTHLADPTKLINSATRLYGDRMDTLWGEIAPVPGRQITVLEGGETLSLGGREIEVAYTPGHAWHHVSYFDRESGTGFVGDTGGLRSRRLPVLPVTPPPDFDLEAWLTSIDRILEWSPKQLALTHFGMFSDPDQHLHDLRTGLVEWTGFARVAVTLAGSEEDRFRHFSDRLRGWIQPRVEASLVEAYLASAGPLACWQGLARYLKTVTSDQ
jgi:glyoxylase-like metal-dependent hydrolase (beta-lactamase superfamily II)